MRVFRNEMGVGYILAIIFGVGVILVGCAPTFNSLNDPVASFSTFKSYRWSTDSSTSRQNSLIEKNVRYYADASLKNKGFTLVPDRPDFVIAMNYETDYYRPYELRVLNLYVYGMQTKEPIWQGTASGTIKVDAASPDLAEAVKNILMNFPPKR